MASASSLFSWISTSSMPSIRPQRLGGNGDVAADFGHDQVGTDRSFEIGRCALGLEESIRNDADAVGQSSASSRYCVVTEDRGAELAVQPPHLGQRTAERLAGSSPVVGSSRNRICGRWINDIARSSHASCRRCTSRPIVDGGADVDEADHRRPSEWRCRRCSTRTGDLGVAASLGRSACRRSSSPAAPRRCASGCHWPVWRRRSRRRSPFPVMPSSVQSILHRGRLTGTVRAEEAVDLAVRNVEVDARHRIVRAEGSCEGVGLDR